jgi:hypothetical protein
MDEDWRWRIAWRRVKERPRGRWRDDFGKTICVICNDKKNEYNVRTQRPRCWYASNLTQNLSPTHTHIYMAYMRQNSSGDIATGYGLHGPGSILGSSSPQRPYRFWCPPILLYVRYRGLFPREVKRQGREADQSPPSNAEDMKGGAIPPLSHVFMV